MSYRCRICAQSFHTASDYHQHEAGHITGQVLACPQCLQEFPTAGELHAHVANDRHTPARMSQQSSVRDGAVDPRWAAPHAFDESGNRISFAPTTADYAMDPAIQYHPGHYIAEGGFGGAVHSQAVVLTGGVTVYLPDAQQAPLSPDAFYSPSTQTGGVSSSPHMIRNLANNESERQSLPRFIYPSTRDVADEALARLPHVERGGARSMNTNSTLQPAGQSNHQPEDVHAGDIEAQPTD